MARQMNLRILELADKAIEDMPGAWNIPDEFCKKFAELIVQECANIVANRKDQAIDNGLNVDEAMSIVEMDLLEHFGVKS